MTRGVVGSLLGTTYKIGVFMKQEPTYSAKIGPRLDFALSHARMSRKMLIDALKRDYGIVLSRSTLSKLLTGTQETTKYTMEIADILGVNPRWLQTGRETMTDMTGRLSSKHRGLADVKRIARTHIIPPKRADIVRLHDKLITAAFNNRLSQCDVALLDTTLTRLVGPENDEDGESLNQAQN